MALCIEGNFGWESSTKAIPVLYDEQDVGLTQPSSACNLAHMSRMPPTVAVVDRQLCDECGLCMPLCPPLAIEMRREGLLVDPVVCTGCMKCIDPCPVGALSMVANPLLLHPLPSDPRLVA